MTQEEKTTLRKEAQIDAQGVFGPQLAGAGHDEIKVQAKFSHFHRELGYDVIYLFASELKANVYMELVDIEFKPIFTNPRVLMMYPGVELYEKHIEDAKVNQDPDAAREAPYPVHQKYGSTAPTYIVPRSELFEATFNSVLLTDPVVTGQDQTSRPPGYSLPDTLEDIIPEAPPVLTEEQKWAEQQAQEAAYHLQMSMDMMCMRNRWPLTSNEAINKKIWEGLTFELDNPQFFHNEPNRRNSAADDEVGSRASEPKESGHLLRPKSRKNNGTGRSA